jgi:hypothetical protein
VRPLCLFSEVVFAARGDSFHEKTKIKHSKTASYNNNSARNLSAQFNCAVHGEVCIIKSKQPLNLQP